MSSRVGVQHQRTLGADLRGWLDFYVQMATESDESESPTEIDHKAGWGTLNLAAGMQLGHRRRSQVIIELKNLADKYYVPAAENLVAQGMSAVIKLGFDF